MKRKLLTAALLMAGSVLTACAGGAGVFIAEPPPPRYGVIGVAPGPGFVWTDGFWDLRGGAWAWAPGRWVRSPRPRAVWVAPAWRHEGRHWRYHRGHWR
ncbi:MAG: hypothetical protein WB579_09395 [Bryobacteraceae bacterium]